MRLSRHARRAGVVAVALVAVTACSGSSSPKATTTPTASASPPPPSTLADRVVADGAQALWTLQETRLQRGSALSQSVPGGPSAKVVGGTIALTTGPRGVPAAQFFRSGRIVTSVTQTLDGAHAFSLEFNVRADTCSTAWGRVLGTTALTDKGREGFDVVHFPKLFRKSPCDLGVEFWHQGRFLGGCGPLLPPAKAWAHWVVSYSGGVVTCHVNGRQIGRSRVGVTFTQPDALGIGGSGSGWQGPADGVSLSDVAYYNKTLTPAEIAAHIALERKAPA